MGKLHKGNPSTEASQVENIKKIASKINHPDKQKRIDMAIEINELAKILIAQYNYKMKNAIAYTRVSSRRQVDDGNSLDTQKQILTEYARRNNIKINKWFIEEGESAKTTDRTMLKKILEYSINHKGENSLLLIYS